MVVFHTLTRAVIGAVAAFSLAIPTTSLASMSPGDVLGALESSSLATVSVVGAPSAPQNLAAPTNDGAQLTVAWEAPSDPGDSALTDYVLQYKRVSSTSWTTISGVGTNTSHTFPNPRLGLDFIFRVHARNSQGLSPADTLTVSTPTTRTVVGAPSAPQNLAAPTNNGSQLTVAWDAPSDPGDSAVTEYVLQYKRASSTRWTTIAGVGANTSHTFNNPRLGLTFNFRVYARNSQGLSSADTMTVTTPGVPGEDEELRAAIVQRLSSLSGTYSVSVRELGGEESAVSIAGGIMQEPVSVIKVFVAYAVLDRIERGVLSLSTPTRSGVSVQNCLRAMIHVSDNYCHWDLVDLVGKQNLNNQFWAEGYRRTVYDGYSGGGIYYPAKLSTTDDLALLLTRLHRGELLNPSLTAHFMELLETQLWRSKLPASVSAGVPVGNKTGSAWTANGWYHSDAGIISAPGGTYVVAVLGSRGATSTGVREIGRIVYEHFNGPIGTAARYSDLNSVTQSAVTYYRYASTSTPLGTIPAGLRIETYASARTWYQVRYNGSLVYVRSSGLRNYYDYPRS